MTRYFFQAARYPELSTVQQGMNTNVISVEHNSEFFVRFENEPIIHIYFVFIFLNNA
jgi:hypothetical protein